MMKQKKRQTIEDVRDIELHNAAELEFLADTLQDLAREQESFLQTGDLEHYVETMPELLEVSETSVNELCYPTPEQQALLGKIKTLLKQFSAQVQETEKLLQHLAREQEQKRQAQLRVYWKANGYTWMAQVKPGWLYLLAGSLLAVLVVYWSCA